MSKHVSCFLMGGLGNQLFQIFATIAYGMRYQHRVVFPHSDVLTVGTVRNTYWHNLLKNIQFMTTKNKTLQITNRDLQSFELCKEQGFQYENLEDMPNHDVILYGYFQSYKYFDDEILSIVSLIRLRYSQKQTRDEYPLLFSEDIHYISMHFRLGDYVNLQDHHPLMPYEYYENALRFVLDKRGNKRYRVLYFCQAGDNAVVIPMVKTLIENLSLSPETFIKIDDSIDDWKQMLLMSSCHDNIIANSTFSWWGGYFNETPNKLVCYPHLWFGSKLNHNNTCDLFPDSWHKIAF